MLVLMKHLVDEIHQILVDGFSVQMHLKTAI